MKIIVIGYSKMFAAIVDAVLHSKHELVGVLRHDKIKYNPFRLFFKDILNPSNDISLIKSKKLYEINVNSVNSKKFKRKLLKLKPDIVFVCSWSEKINKEILDIPSIGFINIHPSLLPKYRGPNPYTRVIFNNEKMTGVTFHLVTEELDAGPIFMQKSFDILDSDDGLSLKNKAASIANIMCTNFLEKTKDSVTVATPQKQSEATYYPHITYNDMILDFSKPSDELSRRIRGLYPWAKAYIEYDNKFLAVNKFLITENKSGEVAGKIIYKKGRDVSIVTVDNKVIHFFDLKLVKTLFAPSTRLFIKYKMSDTI